MFFLKPFIISLVLLLKGFQLFIYFLAEGYGLSVAGIGLYLLYEGGLNLSLEELIIGLLYITYGIRLALFMALRRKNTNYKNKVSDSMDKIESLKFGPRIIFWILLALLYICQTSPLNFRINSAKKGDKLSYFGIIIMIIGFLIELTADKQKDSAKKINPHRFVDSGLYKIVRCPNFFGEITFWIGNFIGGIGIYNSIFRWSISFFGLIAIIYIMYDTAKRLEKRQNKNYKNDPVYQKYIKTTPILIPFIGSYTFEKQEKKLY